MTLAAIYARILLTMGCLLALATSASAECTWVLSAHGPKAGYYWKPVRAWETADQCAGETFRRRSKSRTSRKA